MDAHTQRHTHTHTHIDTHHIYIYYFAFQLNFWKLSHKWQVVTHKTVEKNTNNIEVMVTNNN